MKKKIIIVTGVLAVVGIFLFFGARYFMSKPMYESGMVRALPDAAFIPRKEIQKNYWNMGNGIELFHFAEGKGRNVLVVHGGPGFPFWEVPPGFKALSDNFRFHFYDQRGSGRSTRPVDRFSSSNYYENMKSLEKSVGLGTQIADIERIRRILGEEKLIIVGQSFGAFIASMYALEFPQNVEAMVLVAPANMLTFPQEGKNLFEYIGELIPRTMEKDYKDFLERYFDFGSIFEKSEDDLVALNMEIVPFYRAAMKAKGHEIPEIPQKVRNGGWMAQALYFSVGQRYDLRPALGTITSPVLVLHGSSDFQSEAVSRIYETTFPNSKFLVIEGSGHTPYYEKQQEFASAVGEFLKNL